jgi:hypothetical protein
MSKGREGNARSSDRDSYDSWAWMQNIRVSWKVSKRSGIENPETRVKTSKLTWDHRSREQGPWSSCHLQQWQHMPLPASLQTAPTSHCHPAFPCNNKRWTDAIMITERPKTVMRSKTWLVSLPELGNLVINDYIPLSTTSHTHMPGNCIPQVSSAAC